MEQININFRKSDRIISQAVCLQVSLVGIKNMLVQAVPFLYQQNTFLNIALLVVVGFIYFRAFVYSRKLTSIRASLVFLFVIISFLVTLAIFPQNKASIISLMPRALPYCFITCYMLSQLRTFIWIEYYMKRYSVVVVVFSVISAVYIYFTGHLATSDYSSYSMPLSYVTLFAVMWLLYRFFAENKIIWLLLSIIGSIIIVIYGSRNPLLAILVYSIVNVLVLAFDSKTKRKLRYFSLAVIESVLLVFWRPILLFLNSIFSRIGIFSRTLYLLTLDEVSLSGRDVIYTMLFEALKEKPLIGYGVLGDEVLLSSIHQSAHSLYLSILSNYGYVIGIIIIATLLIWNFKSYKSANKNDRAVLLIYMCMVWPRGFTGGDIWSSDVFWWMLGLILSLLSYKRHSLMRGYDDD